MVLRIGLCRLVGIVQLQDQRHQCFGDEPAAINTEMAALIRPGPIGIRRARGHEILLLNNSCRVFLPVTPDRLNEFSDQAAFLGARCAFNP